MKSFFGGVAVDGIGMPLTMVLGILVTPLFFRYITSSEYGYWITILDLMAFLNILNAGIGIYTIQTIAGEGTRSVKATENAMSSIVVLLIILLCLMVVTCVGIYALLPPLRDVEGQIRNSRWVFGLMSLNLLISSVWSWLNSIAYGQNRIPLSNGLMLIQKLLLQICPLLLLSLGFGLIAFPISFLSINSLLLLVILFLVLSFLRRFLRFRSLNRKDLGESSLFSARSLLGGASYYVMNFTDTLIIANFVSTASVTIYVLTMKLALVAKFLPGKLMGFAFPSIAHLIQEKSYERLHEVSLKFFRVGLRFGVFSAGFIVVMNGLFVPNWVGMEKYGGYTLTILSAVICFRESVFPIFFNLIYATKDIKTINYIHFIEASLNIGLSLLFLRFWGIEGVALATVVSSCFLSIGYGSYKASRIIQISLFRFIPSLFSTLLRSIPSVAILWLGSVFLQSHFTWIYFILIFLLGCLLNLLCFEAISIVKYRSLSMKELILKVIEEA